MTTTTPIPAEPAGHGYPMTYAEALERFYRADAEWRRKVHCPFVPVADVEVASALLEEATYVLECIAAGIDPERAAVAQAEVWEVAA